MVTMSLSLSIDGKPLTPNVVAYALNIAVAAVVVRIRKLSGSRRTCLLITADVFLLLIRQPKRSSVSVVLDRSSTNSEVGNSTAGEGSGKISDITIVWACSAAASVRLMDISEKKMQMNMVENRFTK